MTLLKPTDDRVNYYKVNIYPTLFGDFLVQKEYGATHFKNPTNTIKQYANSNKEALLLVLDIMIDKKSLGYLKVS